MQGFLGKIESQLEDFANRLGLAGLTLANEDGLVLAAAGVGVDTEFLAAVSPLVREEATAPETMVQASSGQRGLNVQVLNLEVDNQSLFLCAAGDERRVSDPSLQTLLQGIRSSFC